MNNVTLIGNLTRNPQLFSGRTGTSYALFTLAVDSGWGENKTVDFISCVAFKKTAELLVAHTSKGAKIGLAGRISTGKYEKHGRTVFTTDVLASEIQFLSRKKNEDSGSSETSDSEVSGSDKHSEDEIPF